MTGYPTVSRGHAVCVVLMRFPSRCTPRPLAKLTMGDRLVTVRDRGVRGWRNASRGPLPVPFPGGLLSTRFASYHARLVRYRSCCK